MSKNEELILEGIKTLVNRFQSGAQLYVGKVLDVDKEKSLISVVIEDLADTLLNIDCVRMGSLEEGNAGIKIFPKKNAYVLVIKDEEGWFLMNCDEIDGVQLCVSKMMIEIDNTGKIGIKCDGQDLLNVLNELVDEIGKITVPTAVGVSGLPINKTQIAVVGNKFKNILKSL